MPTRALPRARTASASSSSEKAPVRLPKLIESGLVHHEKYKPKDSSKQQKRRTGLAKKIDEDALNHILEPIGEEERGRWKGWCEVESEPVGDYTEQFYILFMPHPFYTQAVTQDGFPSLNHMC
jgi:hypothetical protein